MDPDLYAAASAGNIGGIMELREKIDQVTENNHETILHIAALSNKPMAVITILEEFPNLLDKVNSRNETALHLAAGNGHHIVVDVLINKARGFNFGEISPEAIDFIRKGNVDLDTALHLAVRNHHEAVVKLIVLSDPSDEHSQNLKFETPLYLAAIAGNSATIYTILGVCRNASVDGPEGRTALHAAVISQKYFCVHLILNNRGDLYERADNKGWTAFHYAASLNSVSVLEHLIRWGNPDTRGAIMAMISDTKQTAHHIAAYEGHITVLMQLMEYCPDACDIVDEDDRNILHIAAEQNHKDLIQAILQDFPDVVYKLLNMQKKNGNTPLHLLVLAGCFVPELIKHKFVDRDIKNYENFTPLDLLYLDENIVGDQLMIKNAFEDTKVNYWHKVVMKWGWFKELNLWITKIRSNRRRRQLIPRSSAHEIKRRRKDAKFKIANTDIVKEKVEFNRGRTNTQIIVTALIATVTFTVGFTMPGGNYGDGDVNEGLAILSKKTAFNVCMLADAVGLLFSTSSLFLYFISSLYQDPREVSKFIAVSTGFNIVSVVAMMLTFITGTYVVLFHSPALAIAVSIISCMFFLLVILLLVKLTFDPSEKFNV